VNISNTQSPIAFPDIRFQGKLRPSQAQVVEIATQQLSAGQRRLHIVAPPGSGKTVLGLYLWAESVRRPALVLSPNSAIQAQWGARTDLFRVEGAVPDAQSSVDLVSLDAARPAWLTSLTYQAVTMTESAGADTDEQAKLLWRESLVESEHAQDMLEADVWIRDLERHNSDYYDQRLSIYRKKIRERKSLAGETLSFLHPNSHATFERLRDANVGLLILDECHHLMGHWGRVLAEARTILNDPIVVGLTATPPDRSGRKSQDIERYDEFFGPIDFEVPVPAVVKDGYLAPYQDLAYFVRPTGDELAFVANADDKLKELIERLCRQRPALETEPGIESEATFGQRGEQPSDEQPSDEQIEQHFKQQAVQTDQRENELLDEADLSDETDPPLAHLADISLATEQFDAEAESQTKQTESTDLEQEETVPFESQAAFSEEYLCAESLPQWLLRVLSERRLPTGAVKDWRGFHRRDPGLADASRLFLHSLQIPLPENVPAIATPVDFDPNSMEVFVPVLDRYIRHRLRRSADPRDHALARMAIGRLRILGIQITEIGARACASPVGRVLAYSTAKHHALIDILRTERQTLGPALRAVVITDFEKSSAVSSEVSHLLDEESGGAVAAFKTLVNHPSTDPLNAILVTGSSVLVDDDVTERFLQAARDWLKAKNFQVDLSEEAVGSFHVINGRGSDWCPRVYVELITDLFQQGLTQCLVGTRGLLGEGWDANRINVLVDLTTVTTSMTVNQLRGRSIRLDPQDPQKLANNWDVVCIAPEFAKGLDDYRRFEAKHHSLYGVTDDGAIEKGVGHVHAAFTEMKPEGIEGSTSLLNADMLARIGQRDHFRGLWKIGKPYRSEPIRAVEAKIKIATSRDFPPFRSAIEIWNGETLAMAISQAVLYALDEVWLIRHRRPVHVGVRSGDYVRVFLDEATEAENQIFGEALSEALGPLDRPRYVIERFVDRREETWLSRLSPEITRRFFQRNNLVRVMLHAVPSVLSKNKDLATTYQRYWNRFVSPGELIYTLHESGTETLHDAQRKGQTPQMQVRTKDVFL
jgi:superfamily II DNA or RNA helicase